ncbi:MULTISPECIES: DUF4242 domain-containing protein [unclassified Mycobacterium]|uniref:DUF4242 domain-containing protein n=1 Tax=unclassified Mycobacterium TaxID=2642494 RepID=UPI0007FCE580|nr:MULTISPECIES: DUF4242 domain-containing protein [unclassified Mycobacterium]OBH04563.1 hypothetical protein A5696_04550 [Mycobacterium sp. E2699]OBI54181.1 hypothetical protein A5705_01315 [Mycobacterium sp. E787]
MSLYLYEIAADGAERADATHLIKELDARLYAAGGELIEAQVTRHPHRIFAVTEFPAAPPPRLDAASFGVEDISGPDEVRLVGADLDELKAIRPAAGYLVEWDLPAGLDMQTYLDRKKAKAPRYADVPEVSFLRTYVRADMYKCLCFYDAPDESAVRRAREAVDTPVDRLHGLEGPLR